MGTQNRSTFITIAYFQWDDFQRTTHTLTPWMKGRYSKSEPKTWWKHVTQIWDFHMKYKIVKSSEAEL